MGYGFYRETVAFSNLTVNNNGFNQSNQLDIYKKNTNNRRRRRAKKNILFVLSNCIASDAVVTVVAAVTATDAVAALNLAIQS